MKYSKMIPIWRRKKHYAEFVRIPLIFRTYLYGNKFESYCKRIIDKL